MKDKLYWLQDLPFTLAVGLFALGIVRKIFRIPVTFSFSQGAEDILLGYLLSAEKGTYIDVGCNEPVRFSNTFNLYLQGWRGVNIDANKELVEKCKAVRKGDISVCAAVSDSEKELIFHKSTTAAVSTLDAHRFKHWQQIWDFPEKDREKVTTRTLTAVLNEYLSPGACIDLLTIDVEGHDFHVLKGLDFKKYRPKMIIIEMHSAENMKETDIYKFLTKKNYTFKYYAVLNAYFVDSNILI